MNKRNDLETGSEFEYSDDYFEKILEEMENDPEFQNFTVPDEWDREFRKTIEETLKKEKRKKMKRYVKIATMAACAVLAVTAGLNMRMEEVQGEGLLEVFQNTFNLNGKQYTTFDVGEKVDFYTEEEQDEVYFEITTLDDVYRQIREELKVPMFYMTYIPDGYNITEAKYSKVYNVLELKFENDMNTIYISQHQQVDEIAAGIENEEEKCLEVKNEKLDQKIFIFQSIQDNNFVFNIKVNHDLFVMRASTSLEECEKIAENLDFY